MLLPAYGSNSDNVRRLVKLSNGGLSQRSPLTTANAPYIAATFSYDYRTPTFNLFLRPACKPCQPPTPTALLTCTRRVVQLLFIPWNREGDSWYLGVSCCALSLRLDRLSAAQKRHIAETSALWKGSCCGDPERCERFSQGASHS